ncbi:hypothetical protein Pan44_32740 [Caulifigura coniformis]|uniref:HEAT repeat protein n=1 Tax=Caulifigura coniformis TaxID=2527983 RepID=A0A517SGH7_9PLAN|nr:hypothetical protein [Caulifigura coniformis]QDT55232.1 hypothetical protein Pan44_32740 [Caulifigura coniformis]
MRTLKTCAAVVAVLAMSNLAHAARTSARLSGASKCCECAPTSIAPCCKPTIPRPCTTNVYTYQRQISCLKPPCCDSGCGPKRCCRPRRHGANCGNGSCGNGCDPNGACCNNGCGNSRRSRRACGDVCGSGSCDQACQAPCQTYTSRDNGNACAIAQLIYQSQTGCYARTRRAALRRLAKYDCSCNPEIMSAFVYALNDAVETVRSTAADAIGDQVRRNPCCCSPCIVNALTNTLGDCNRRVRKNAEKALCACGYEVVTPVCEEACDVQACAAEQVPVYSPAAGQQPPAEPEATPPPPAEPKAQTYKGDASMHTVSSKKSLKNIFGLLR